MLLLIQGSVLGNAGVDNDNNALQQDHHNRAYLSNKYILAPTIAEFAQDSDMALDQKQYMAY